MIHSGMRIAAVAIASTFVVVAIASASSPPPGKLTGHINPSGHARLDIRYRTIDHRKARVYKWDLDRIPLKCKGPDGIARDPLTGGETVANKYAGHKPFGLSAIGGNPKHPDYRATVSGRLVGQDKARGIVRLSGSNLALRGGGHRECDSGRLHWHVERR